MTEKLYYKDSHLKNFNADVVSCVKTDKGYEIILDKTAFFPEGGGQPSDIGTIENVNVSCVFERGGDVVHIADASVDVGADVSCTIDWERRFGFMQSHSGEHIVSGIVHNIYGYSNVGFHMGSDGVIIDFDGYLSPEQVADVELKVNEVITKNAKITTFFPAPEELPNIEYRSKLDLTENVRLVSIEGYDLCACCAPHVSLTGEIGLVKLLESAKHRGGVRIRMLAGREALADYRQKSETTHAVSALLSAKEDSIPQAVERMIAEKERLSWDMGALKRRVISDITDSHDKTDKCAVFFEPTFSADDMRLLVNSLVSKCRICAVFSGEEENYQYIVGSSSCDMKEYVKQMNASLSGRGGGTSTMVQGSVKATEKEIRKYFDDSVI